MGASCWGCWAVVALPFWKHGSPPFQVRAPGQADHSQHQGLIHNCSNCLFPALPRCHHPEQPWGFLLSVSKMGKDLFLWCHSSMLFLWLSGKLIQNSSHMQPSRATWSAKMANNVPVLQWAFHPRMSSLEAEGRLSG